MTINLVFAVLMVSVSLQGCMIFDPYVTQPKPGTTLSDATNGLDKVQSELNYLVKEQGVVGGTTGLLTLVGFGGAGISAIFHASLTSILAFTAVGASSLAFNGLYANSPRVAIYHAGLDAVTCVKRAIAPLTAHHRKLISYLQSLQDREDAVLSRLTETQTTAPRSIPPAQTVLNKATDTRKQIQSKLAREDISAPEIMTATSSIVSALNDQLRTVIPDAAALARVGAGLNTQIVAGIPQQGANTGPANKVDAPTIKSIMATQILMANVYGPNPDKVLEAYINNLQDEINEVTPIIVADVTPPSIACKVANSPTMKPMKVVLPAGSKGIDYPPTNGKVSVPIEGGTPPYTSIQWSGPQPTCFSAVIQSPNTLYLSSATGQTCVAGDKFTFDIYDVQGQHLNEPVVVIIK